MKQILPSANPSNEYGKRIRIAITLCGMKFPAFCQKHKISLSYLYAIEKGKHSLSQGIAKRIVLAMQQEGYFCSTNWLLAGEGISPCTFEELKKREDSEHNLDLKAVTSLLTPELKVIREIAFFRDLHSDCIVVGVFDDSMEPFYSLGDYVAGIFKKKEEVETCMGVNCIIQLTSGEQIIKRLLKGNKEEFFTLSSTNPHTKVENPILYNQKIEKIAPIIWHRRKDY
ncbi:MAG: hypothetical protein K2W94_08710 [Alphaproteobacteria bacterium]|nr:hypothetical protein [Alphaproteobacteria bacterium]